MGLFDIFKKKKEPVQNSLNSVFTLRFAVPYFPVFDKTNPKLRSFPVKLACGGSVQYRIAEPDLCFDNVPLGQMSAAQLEEHVKDSLVTSVKHFINMIDYIPLLQFETELMRINELAKRELIPLFAEEYGINLRTFNLSRISYDEDDVNYKRLCAQSSALSDKMATHDLEDLEMDHEDNKHERIHQRRVRKVKEDEELIDREAKVRLQQQSAEHELQRKERQHKHTIEANDLELERKKRELEEDMHARRSATDRENRRAEAEIKIKEEKARNKAKAEKLGLDIFDEDLGALDDSIDI